MQIWFSTKKTWTDGRGIIIQSKSLHVLCLLDATLSDCLPISFIQPCNCRLMLMPSTYWFSTAKPLLLNFGLRRWSADYSEDDSSPAEEWWPTPHHTLTWAPLLWHRAISEWVTSDRFCMKGTLPISATLLASSMVLRSTCDIFMIHCRQREREM